jgi:predicted nucleic acid-binding protein
MNGPLVVDASTLVKLVLPESLSQQADSLYQDALSQQQPLLGPPHLLSETTNAIFQRWRTTDPSKHISATAVDQAIALLLQYPVQLVAPAGLYSAAATFARTHRLPTVYDSLYVVVAQLAGGDLWTADQRLVRAVSSVAPWVRWLGSYPLPP